MAKKITAQDVLNLREKLQKLKGKRQSQMAQASAELLSGMGVSGSIDQIAAALLTPDTADDEALGVDTATGFYKEEKKDGKSYVEGEGITGGYDPKHKGEASIRQLGNLKGLRSRVLAEAAEGAGEYVAPKSVDIKTDKDPTPTGDATDDTPPNPDTSKDDTPKDDKPKGDVPKGGKDNKIIDDKTDDNVVDEAVANAPVEFEGDPYKLDNGIYKSIFGIAATTLPKNPYSVKQWIEASKASTLTDEKDSPLYDNVPMTRNVEYDNLVEQDPKRWVDDGQVHPWDAKRAEYFLKRQDLINPFNKAQKKGSAFSGYDKGDKGKVSQNVMGFTKDKTDAEVLKSEMDKINSAAAAPALEWLHNKSKKDIAAKEYTYGTEKKTVPLGRGSSQQKEIQYPIYSWQRGGLMKPISYTTKEPAKHDWTWKDTGLLAADAVSLAGAPGALLGGAAKLGIEHFTDGISQEELAQIGAETLLGLVPGMGMLGKFVGKGIGKGLGKVAGKTLGSSVGKKIAASGLGKATKSTLGFGKNMVDVATPSFNKISKALPWVTSAGTGFYVAPTVLGNMEKSRMGQYDMNNRDTYNTLAAPLLPFTGRIGLNRIGKYFGGKPPVGVGRVLTNPVGVPAAAGAYKPIFKKGGVLKAQRGLFTKKSYAEKDFDDKSFLGDGSGDGLSPNAVNAIGTVGNVLSGFAPAAMEAAYRTASFRRTPDIQKRSYVGGPISKVGGLDPSTIKSQKDSIRSIKSTTADPRLQHLINLNKQEAVNKAEQDFNIADLQFRKQAEDRQYREIVADKQARNQHAQRMDQIDYANELQRQRDESALFTASTRPFVSEAIDKIKKSNAKKEYIQDTVINPAKAQMAYNQALSNYSTEDTDKMSDYNATFATVKESEAKLKALKASLQASGKSSDEIKLDPTVIAAEEDVKMKMKELSKFNKEKGEYDMMKKNAALSAYANAYSRSSLNKNGGKLTANQKERLKLQKEKAITKSNTSYIKNYRQQVANLNKEKTAIYKEQLKVDKELAKLTNKILTGK